MAVGFILNTTWKAKMEIPVKPPGQTTRRNQMRFLILLLLAAAAIGQGARFEAVVVKPAAFIVANPAAQGPNDGALYSAAGLSRWWMVSLGYETLYIDADARKFPFVRSTIYSISAKIPNGIGRDRIPEMVRNLLADRFGLMCHTEQRTVKGFSLTLTDLHKLKTNGAFTERLQHPQLHVAVHVQVERPRIAYGRRARNRQIRRRSRELGAADGDQPSIERGHDGSLIVHFEVDARLLHRARAHRVRLQLRHLQGPAQVTQILRRARRPTGHRS